MAITHGGTDPNRAVLGLLTAGKLLENGAETVHVWLVLEGAELANRNKAARIESPIFKKFGSSESMLIKLREKGAKISVCPLCAEYAGAVGKERYEFIDQNGAEWLAKNAGSSNVLCL